MELGHLFSIQKLKEVVEKEGCTLRELKRVIGVNKHGVYEYDFCYRVNVTPEYFPTYFDSEDDIKGFLVRIWNSDFSSVYGEKCYLIIQNSRWSSYDKNNEDKDTLVVNLVTLEQIVEKIYEERLEFKKEFERKIKLNPGKLIKMFLDVSESFDICIENELEKAIQSTLEGYKYPLEFESLLKEILVEYAEVTVKLRRKFASDIE